ncbi:Ectopic P granules protein 5 [Nymphon striatum]|nr:Ectopic P granules protein 5 [Nymphon striatum]
MLLSGYLQSRNKLICITKEMEKFQEHCKNAKDQCWKFSVHNTSGQAKCADGKLLKASDSYNYANFDFNFKDIVTSHLKDIRGLLEEKFSLHNHEVEMAFLQIETYVYNSLNSAPAFIDIPLNAPVKSYLSEERDRDTEVAIDHLKICISILFHFQRMQISDFKFVQETRNWLTKLVSVLLRMASVYDHLFLLNHVLRCSAGFSKWAGIFVQPPPPPTFFVQMTGYAPILGCEQLDLNITCLATILLPVKAREQFLSQLRSSLQFSSLEKTNVSKKDASWTVVDSDGEEDENPDVSWLNFQENDLVALFNQIPIADIFRHVLFVENKGDIDDYDVKKTNEQSMLKLMAFSTVMMHLLQCGIRTYSAPRYYQFNKRLCQTIRDSVQFVADHLFVFKKTSTFDNNAWIMRIDVEYDQLFLRAAKAIYSSTSSGAWQFLAEMPYKSVSLYMLWRILWVLHHSGDSDVQLTDLANWKSRLNERDSMLALEEKLSRLPISEAFHLLNTFASMASSRNEIDKDFIQAVSVEVFKISFLSTHTRDACSKEGRNLLNSIATEHTFVLSVLFDQTTKKLEDLGKMSIYLFSGLPLCIWFATEADFDGIIKLLQQDPSSISNQLARTILSGLNWSYIPNDTKLFFDMKVHHKIALIISKSCEKYNVERRQFGLMSQMLKQVSHVTSDFSNYLSHEQKFVLWAWEILPRFHLHVCDNKILNETLMTSENDNPARDLHNCNSLNHLKFGIDGKQPVACFVALMISTVGHRKSELCTEGFRLLKNLIDCQLYTPALHVLSCITPLFYGSPEFLANDSFVSMIKSILFAEVTYFKMTKKLIAELSYFEVTKKMITPTFPGPILKEFSAMIENSLAVATSLGPDGKKQAIQLWITVLTKIPEWNNDHCTLFILNKIVCYIFNDRTCMDFMKLCLQKFYEFISGNPLQLEFTQIPSCERENHPLQYPYPLQEIKAVLLKIFLKVLGSLLIDIYRIQTDKNLIVWYQV